MHTDHLPILVIRSDYKLSVVNKREAFGLTFENEEFKTAINISIVILQFYN